MIWFVTVLLHSVRISRAVGWIMKIKFFTWSESEMFCIFSKFTTMVKFVPLTHAIRWISIPSTIVFTFNVIVFVHIVTIVCNVLPKFRKKMDWIGETSNKNTKDLTVINMLRTMINKNNLKSFEKAVHHQYL